MQEHLNHKALNIHDFAQDFKRHYTIIPAVGDALKQQGYRIRHEVYCRELGFEEIRADGMEYDEFDHRSIQCLIHATANNHYVGCARIVPTSPLRDEMTMPLEHICDGQLNPDIVDFIHANRGQVAEASRLSIIAQYRSKSLERNTVPAIHEGSSLTPVRLPYRTLALYLGLIAMSRFHGIDHLFLLTEKALGMSIKKLGWAISQVGNVVDFHGHRMPFMIDLEQTLSQLNPSVRTFYAAIEQEIQLSFSAANTPDFAHASS